MKNNQNCIWIGIGIDVPEGTRLYHAVVEVNNLLVKKYGANPAGNGFPHLNLYDLSVSKDNLDNISRRVKEILDDEKSFVIKTGKVNCFPFGTIFLEVEENNRLKKLHEKIVNEVVKLKGNCIDEDYLAPHRKYSRRQRELLMQYGNPHVLDQFQPHITIGFVRGLENRLFDICEKLNIEPQKFDIDNIHIASNKGIIENIKICK